MAHMIGRLPRGQPKLQSGGEQPSHAQLASQRYFSEFVGWGDVRPRLIPTPSRQFAGLIYLQQGHIIALSMTRSTVPRPSAVVPAPALMGVESSSQIRLGMRLDRLALPRRRAETQRRRRLASPSPSRIHECRCNYTSGA